MKADAFLPRTRAQMEARGWDERDIVLVTGDGYGEHPSFGGAVIGRVLEAEGYRVGILDVPEMPHEGAPDGWDRLPSPRLFVGVTAGAGDAVGASCAAAKGR